MKPLTFWHICERGLKYTGGVKRTAATLRTQSEKSFLRALRLSGEKYSSSHMRLNLLGRPQRMRVQALPERVEAPAGLAFR